MFSEDQKAYMCSLDTLPRSELCLCGWYTEKECAQRCLTGNRTDASAPVRRIKEIYQQIDMQRARLTKENPHD